jgi:hypothetical protein
MELKNNVLVYYNIFFCLECGDLQLSGFALRISTCTTQSVEMVMIGNINPNQLVNEIYFSPSPSYSVRGKIGHRIVFNAMMYENFSLKRDLPDKCYTVVYCEK